MNVMSLFLFQRYNTHGLCDHLFPQANTITLSVSGAKREGRLTANGKVGPRNDLQVDPESRESLLLGNNVAKVSNALLIFHQFAPCVATLHMLVHGFLWQTKKPSSIRTQNG